MRLAKILPLLCVLALGVSATMPLAASVPVRDFARSPQYDEVAISPEGEYLAVRAPVGAIKALVVLRLADLKVMTVIDPPPGEQVVDFAWVGPDRLIYSRSLSEGPLAAPIHGGELLAVNADGSKQKYLFGFRGRSNGRFEGTFFFGAASLVSPLLDDPRHALIAVRNFRDVHRRPVTLERIDVYSGSRSLVMQAPAAGDTRFAVDRHGQVHYVSVRDRESLLYTQSWVRSEDLGRWESDRSLGEAKVVAWPLGVAADGKSVYLSSTEGGDKQCLVRRSLVGETRREVLACDEDADLVGVLMGSEAGPPLAALFAGGRREARWLETDSPDQRLLKRLSASFGGDQIDLVSRTRDGSRLVLRVNSDRNPGDYYLYDRATDRADYLISNREWLEPVQMAEQRVIALKSRDGHPLWAYLTLPPGSEAKDLPLIVHPHGGPFFVRDHWGWDADPQFLASRGYAVLQVNFRGSEGYGNQHVLAAKKAWGTVMIDDITDAARHVIGQGIADPARLCIYGASYGGYAALMSAVREPGMYRCAVSYVGVYDMALFQRHTDVSRSVLGERYLEDWVAGTPEEIALHSPSTYIDRLKAPVMIIHGEADERVPFTQAKALRDALEARKHPYTWLSKPNEGHGFYDEGNRTELYEKLLAFFDQHLAPPVVADPALPP